MTKYGVHRGRTFFLWLPAARDARWSFELGLLGFETSLGSGGSEGEPMEEAALASMKSWRDARSAFRSGATRSKEWRIRQLKAVERLVSEREREIQDALLEDLRKPPFETWWSEILVVTDSVKNAMKELSKWMAPEKASTPLQAAPCSAAIVSEPLGVVLVISTWNFPFMLCMVPVIGAIAAGNAVVLKPSELAPATAKLLATLLPSYLDPNAVKVVLGGVSECTSLLNLKWDKIIFTGSARVGRIILSAAAKHLTPVILELGGKNPLYLDSSVDLKTAVRRIAFGKWGTNNGQACASPDYVLAEKSLVPALVSALKDVIREFYGDDPRKSPDLARIINNNHFKRLENLLEDSAGKVVHGGQQDEIKRYIEPTLLLDVPMDSSVMKEEIFGPLLPIVAVHDVDDAIEIINSRPKPLIIYAFTSRKETKEKLVAETSSGSLVFNDTIIQFGILSLPFGGVGESGMGAYHGKFSFDSFSHKKPVLYRHCIGDVAARYPPFTDFREDIARRIMDYDFLGAILRVLGITKRTFYRGSARH